MTICGPFAVIHVLMNGSHHGGTRQRSDACFCEFLRFLCEIKAFIPEAVNVNVNVNITAAGCPLNRYGVALTALKRFNRCAATLTVRSTFTEAQLL
jgi:hypothetical protein